jgi:hypothetical protein
VLGEQVAVHVRFDRRRLVPSGMVEAAKAASWTRSSRRGA